MVEERQEEASKKVKWEGELKENEQDREKR